MSKVSNPGMSWQNIFFLSSGLYEEFSPKESFGQTSRFKLLTESCGQENFSVGVLWTRRKIFRRMLRTKHNPGKLNLFAIHHSPITNHHSLLSNYATKNYPFIICYSNNINTGGTGFQIYRNLIDAATD